MTSDRDFKRLVRARMRKTGESYTTARAQLLAKTRPDKQGEESSESDYETLAGMSDQAVEAKTGLTWQEWVEALDRYGAHAWSHREIAAHVAKTWSVSGWWAQSVTVGYERIKGLREAGQRRDGTYDVNRSRTVPVALERLYSAFADDSIRARWMPETDLTIRKATADKSMRVTWEDGSSLDLYFRTRGEGKSQVTLQHRKLSSKEEADSLKAWWGERLDALAEQLTSR